ncbi:hypothetical protein [Serratia rubidaea]|uniref:hypothetical protein n=1 Tax=Serratia rubidaea TaxID=61652 RepID=UPI0011DFCE37|nr:hypothetical protein [Serratia rubidaea]
MKTELKAGDFCIHRTKWGDRGCEIVAFHRGYVVVYHFGTGYRAARANSLTATTEETARRTESNHYAEVRRG